MAAGRSGPAPRGLAGAGPGGPEGGYLVTVRVTLPEAELAKAELAG